MLTTGFSAFAPLSFSDLLSAGALPEHDPAAIIDAEVKSANMVLDKKLVLFINIPSEAPLRACVSSCRTSFPILPPAICASVAQTPVTAIISHKIYCVNRHYK